jgi:hypothetical protein
MRVYKSIDSLHVLGDESVVVNSPDEQIQQYCCNISIKLIKVEYLPSRVPLPVPSGKIFLAAFGYFSSEVYVIALLKTRGLDLTLL